MKTVRIFVSGLVQGVNFRSFVKDKAEDFFINGFVRNLVDSRVEIVAEGNPDNLKEFIEEVKIGPLGSRVKDVEIKNINHLGLSGFKIMRN